MAKTTSSRGKKGKPTRRGVKAKPRAATKKKSAAKAKPKAKAPPKKKPAAHAKAPATAGSMAKQQREISVSEFFTKNRHLLGFDRPTKALLTTIKEGVDNSLDACEEAGILPDLVVEIHRLAEDRFRVAVEDNGPGIVKAQVPRIFGKLLYGSKFHRLRHSRGQQGIGISAAGMYGQLTTGKPIVIESRIGPKKPAHRFELVIDTRRNEPVTRKDTEIDWGNRPHGTRVEIELEGTYKGGRHGPEEYLRQTALANPHVRLAYRDPKGEETVWDRTVKTLPEPASEIQPHPYGVEVGLLLRMAKDTKSRTLGAFFRQEFSRVGPKSASAIVEGAGLSLRSSPKRLTAEP